MKSTAFLRHPSDASHASVRVAKPPKGPRRKTCATCKGKFSPLTPWAKACSTDCAIALVAVNKAKQERKADKVRKQAMKSRADWIAEAQVAFNAWIRERDIGQPCICCGRLSDTVSRGGTWDAGHYRSRGSAPHMRFVENNVHRQLKNCNRYGAGRAVDYRIGLIERIGLEAVEELERDQTQRKWPIPELIAIRDEYRSKLKQLQKGE